VRPLPRVFAWTDSAICRADDFGARAAAIASGGSSVALVVRAPGATAAERLRFTDRAGALARPAEAALFAHGDPALARIGGAAGVQLRLDDLSPDDARRVAPDAWIGVSVHDTREAARAVDEGADFVVAGNVYQTGSHPDRPARGLDWLARITAATPRVVAIGGVTAARVPELLAAGVWGVAAISALWQATDPARETRAFLEAFAA
jgi:thiamine-phosphate diphosphorylase